MRLVIDQLSDTLLDSRCPHTCIIHTYIQGHYITWVIAKIQGHHRHTWSLYNIGHHKNTGHKNTGHNRHAGSSWLTTKIQSHHRPVNVKCTGPQDLNT